MHNMNLGKAYRRAKLYFIGQLQYMYTLSRKQDVFVKHVQF